MKIGLFGLGYVGSAVFHTHRNQEVIVRDPKLDTRSSSLDEIYSCDAVYVCVPTPMLDTGKCDDSYVKSVLEELKDYKKVIICKSTVPPGVYTDLQKQYPNLVHAPEFLTAANATADYENSTWVLIGGNKEYCDLAKRVIESSTIKAKDYCFTSIETASLFKYMANSFMATKVTFMNDLYHLANAVNVDWNEIKTLTKNDPRLGVSHWDVPGPDGQFGYGGACFPKDVAAIIYHGNEIGASQTLLESVKIINEAHRSR